MSQVEVLAGKYERRITKAWGPGSWAAINALSQAFRSRGYHGPLSVEEPAFLSFLADPSLTIRVVVNVSRCGQGPRGVGAFDLVFSVWSASIFRRTVETDPWFPVGAGYEEWHQGYVPCLTARLSHLKWAQERGDVNPSWLMSADGLQHCLSDLDALGAPYVRSLTSDAHLEKLLECVQNYGPPEWVKSDPPGMRNLGALRAALVRDGRG